MIQFDGQLAIVTGAGREAALALAIRGLRVVVNDYGGDADSISKGQWRLPKP
jgi:NAD(P)-dependent dehydrogenase (short-subunit alcohol dehydrogenase family)